MTVQARDYYGNTRTTGGDVFNVEIGGTASARLRVRDNDNGTYTVSNPLCIMPPPYTSSIHKRLLLSQEHVLVHMLKACMLHVTC
jgi:hypothetical protein